MFSILITSLTDKPLILQWEVSLRSLLGLKGLIEPGLSLHSHKYPQLFLNKNTVRPCVQVPLLSGFAHTVLSRRAPESLTKSRQETSWNRSSLTRLWTHHPISPHCIVQPYLQLTSPASVTLCLVPQQNRWTGHGHSASWSVVPKREKVSFSTAGDTAITLRGSDPLAMHRTTIGKN